MVQNRIDVDERTAGGEKCLSEVWSGDEHSKRSHSQQRTWDSMSSVTIPIVPCARYVVPSLLPIEAGNKAPRPCSISGRRLRTQGGLVCRAPLRTEDPTRIQACTARRSAVAPLGALG